MSARAVAVKINSAARNLKSPPDCPNTGLRDNLVMLDPFLGIGSSVAGVRDRRGEPYRIEIDQDYLTEATRRIAATSSLG